MSEEICGERVKALSAQATSLRSRQVKLQDDIDDIDLTPVTQEQLTAVRDRVKDALADGSPALVKTLLQALIHEIRVESKDAIWPVFRVPLGGEPQVADAVRSPTRSVGRSRSYSNFDEMRLRIALLLRA